MSNNRHEKHVEIYYCLDVGENTDLNTLERCIRVFYEVTFRSICIDKCERVLMTDQDIVPSKEDVIKRGLISLNKMYHMLKLKTNNEVWFLYIGNGDVKKLHSNVSLYLFDKNPSVKECVYVLNKHVVDIDINKSKSEKLQDLSDVTKSLKKLDSSRQVIKYAYIQR